MPYRQHHQEHHDRAENQGQVGANGPGLHLVEAVGGKAHDAARPAHTSHPRPGRAYARGIVQARVCPGGGMWTSSRAWNAKLPNTRRIGWAKLPAVYWVIGLASGNPQSHAAERLTACEAQRCMTYATSHAATAMKMNSSRPL